MKRGKKLIGLGIAVVLGLSLILVPLVSQLSPAQAAGTWTKSGVNPVLIDSVVSGAACVIYDSDAGIYKMWYTHGTTDLDKIDGFVDDILALTLGNLINDIKNLDFSAIAANDATNLKNIIDYLEGLTVSQLETLLVGTRSIISYATSPDGINNWAFQSDVLLPGTAGAWDKYYVGTPWVIRHSPTSYEMWYAGGKTVPGTLLNFLRRTSDLETTLINGTNSAIGHATSTNGIAWTPDANPMLSKGTGDVWDRYGVAAPCVIKIGNTYKMWYTGGRSYLSTFILDVLGGSDLAPALINTNVAIGYAYYTPPPPPPPPSLPPPVEGVTDVTGFITPDGVFTETVIAESFDGLAYLTINEGTIGLIEGEPLSEISMVEMEEPPAPPEDSSVIGLVYDFGPDGATFDPPIILTITYDELLIPEGVAEENLVIAMWDEEAGEWVNLEDITVDPETNTITAKVSHFTAFTVLAYTRLAAFAVSDLSVTPAEVDVGETVTISTLVTNTGDLTGSYEVTFKIDNVVVATKEVTLAGGASQRITFTTAEDVAGTYSVDVSGLTGSFTVKEEVVPPAPAAFAISNLSISPTEVDIGKEVTIGVLIANTGDLTGSYEVTLKIDNVVVATRKVTLIGGASQRVSFTATKDVAGTYSVDVSGLTGSFTVEEEVVPPVAPKPIAWWVWLIVGLGVVVIGGLLAYFLWWRRRIA